MRIAQVSLTRVEFAVLLDLQFFDEDCTSGMIVLFGVEDRRRFVGLAKFRQIDVGLDLVIVLAICVGFVDATFKVLLGNVETGGKVGCSGLQVAVLVGDHRCVAVHVVIYLA